ncbi:IS30 family transposase, partial [Companilactobacillus mishanensis]|uniref:IS30 family transposase n=1 Tax=Companilactobacillus mishanensis TaxID=2486008 RepID=UPI0036328034
VVKQILEHHWSPEQISEKLREEYGYCVVSYGTIYRSIYRNNLGIKKISSNARGIPRNLRHRGKTRHNKGTIETRGKIRISNSIHERPNEANNRLRIGDWELDTVLGCPGGEVLVTVVDRCSRFLISKRANF